MTAKEFIEMAIDTKVTVRDKETGRWIKNESEYRDREVCGCYAKSHRCGNPPKIRSEIVIFVK